ncbi:MAG TPA: hypothetical protein VFG65_01950 [Fimbriimonadales bacterium]|nr:hypothetical protein [Fimbriimonadales bacterium]
MIGLLLAAQLGGLSIEPQFSLPGERFEIRGLGAAEISRPDGMEIIRRGGKVYGVAKGPGASFWATLGPEGAFADAVHFYPPVASGPAIDVGDLAIFPVGDNYGLIARDRGSERRWAKIVALDIAVRSGPRHERPFKPDYVYTGSDSVTFVGSPDKVARLSIRVDASGAHVELVALYDLGGTITILGAAHEINLRSAEAATFDQPL